jgi:hypothetical protein
VTILTSVLHSGLSRLGITAPGPRPLSLGLATQELVFDGARRRGGCRNGRAGEEDEGREDELADFHGAVWLLDRSCGRSSGCSVSWVTIVHRAACIYTRPPL